MIITQIVDIPEFTDDRRLTIDVPLEVPAGRAILAFTPAVESEKTVYSTLTKEKAVSMTAEVIEKYRPALEDLAK